VANGCTFNDPTEDTGPMTLRNHLSRAIQVSYCSNDKCSEIVWTDSIAARGSSSDSVVGDGTRQVFVVDYGNAHRCLYVALTRPLLRAGLDVRTSALRACPTGV
jgi:hypothetical protein